MSAPDTNIEKQESRHKGPLLGMPAAVAVSVVVFLGVIAWVALAEPRTETAVEATTATSEEAGATGAASTTAD